MTASPATDQPTVPDWLAADEAAHQEQIDTVAQGLQRAQRHADLINARLAELGIEPIEAAGIDDHGNLRAARLTQPEYEPHVYYEVRAAWSEDDKQTELHTADWEDDRPRYGRVRLLNSLADVAAARRETPTIPATVRARRSPLFTKEYGCPSAHRYRNQPSSCWHSWSGTDPARTGSSPSADASCRSTPTCRWSASRSPAACAPSRAAFCTA
jgi:hypothetical protein